MDSLSADSDEPVDAYLQWCFLYKNVKGFLHTGHCETSLSGCHGGNTISLCLLTNAVLACDTTGGVGGSARIEAGEESSTIESALVSPALSECILILDGRFMGESAVVKRRLRSPELREDDESVRGEGRFGSVYREEEGFDRASEVAAGLGGGCWLTVSVPSSRRKSIHVSRSCARKCDATTPCEWCLELLPMIASLAPSALLFAPPD
jgi:hypothetical protein